MAEFGLTIAFGEPVVTVELQLGKGHWVLAVLEGDGDEHVVGTTGSNTGHGAGITVNGGGWGNKVNSATEGAGGRVGGVDGIGVVEPLLTVGDAIGKEGVFLHNPDQLFAWVVEVQLDLGGNG